jgi:AcrR family transcriptional regulator
MGQPEPRGSEVLGLRERKKARLRQQIIDTAIRLFRKRGYENTRIEDIVNALEISQPTFFRYFPTKSAVLVDTSLEGIARVIGELRSDLCGDGTTAERLRTFFSRRAHRIESDQSFWRALVLSGAMDPVVSPPVRATDQEMVNILEEILAEGQKRGEVTRDFSVLRLAQTIDGLYKVMVWKWAGEIGGPHSFTEWVGTAVEIFLRGITPPKK